VILALGERTTETVAALREAMAALKGISPWRATFLRGEVRRQTRISLSA
jgi:hypothetical protein